MKSAYPLTLVRFANNAALIPDTSRGGSAPEHNLTPRRLWEIHTETGAGNWRTKVASKRQCEWGFSNMLHSVMFIYDFGSLTHREAIVCESSSSFVLLVEFLFAADGVLHKIHRLWEMICCVSLTYVCQF